MSPNSTIQQLVAREGFSTSRIAVELNRAIIPKAQYGHIYLSPGDRIEIVSFVGGG